jgi:hypothetical protein
MKWCNAHEHFGLWLLMGLQLWERRCDPNLQFRIEVWQTVHFLGGGTFQDDVKEGMYAGAGELDQEQYTPAAQTVAELRNFWISQPQLYDPKSGDKQGEDRTSVSGLEMVHSYAFGLADQCDLELGASHDVNGIRRLYSANSSASAASGFDRRMV